MRRNSGAEPRGSLRRRLGALAILPLALGSASLPDASVVYSSALPLNCPLHQALARQSHAVGPLAITLVSTTTR